MRLLSHISLSAKNDVNFEKKHIVSLKITLSNLLVNVVDDDDKDGSHKTPLFHVFPKDYKI